MFQFYLSSIKSREGKKNQGCLKCFNSTLVQLKEMLLKQCQIMVEQFQFYLSSIKRYLGSNPNLDFSQFQFYLSSIKRHNV